MPYGLGYIIRDTDYEIENIAGLFVSRPTQTQIHIDAQLLVNQPASIIAAMHFMEILYEEKLADKYIELVTSTATLVCNLNIPNPTAEINYNQRIRKTMIEEVYGINKNIVLLDPYNSHDPGTVLQTYGQFVVNSYRNLPNGTMKPRGIWIPIIGKSEFDEAIQAAESNWRSQTNSPNLGVAINSDKTVMCYFFKKSGSQALKAPKSMKKADLRNLLIGYT